MKRQDPLSVYHYLVRQNEQVTVRIKAVGTARLVAAALDEIKHPPPPDVVQVGDWVEYRFVVTKANGNHLLGFRYEFSPHSTNAAHYAHEVVIASDSPPCTYTNIPDMRKGNPLPENDFRFELSTEALEC